MKYLSVDIETTGLDSEKHQILSIGVIVEDTTKKLPFNEIPKFHCAIVQEEIVGGLFALNLNKDLITTINDWNTSNGEGKKQIEQATGMIFCREYEVVQHLFEFLYFNGVLNDLFYLKIRDGIECREVTEVCPQLNTTTVKTQLTVAGKNFGTFDKLFLEKLPRWQQVFKINQRIIDPTVLFTDWKNDKVLPNLTVCKERARTGGKVSHNAVEDAWDIVELMRTQY